MEASSSISSSVQSCNYDVFINHRGPDVKNTLASVIYYHLHDVLNLQVFLDKDELQTGDIIPSSIRRAISAASVHISIFSERYAESAWCLDELCLILDGGSVILPIFYDVTPSDLRRIDSGVYAEAFRKHESKQRFDSETLQKWKDALYQVSFRSGLEFNSTAKDDYGSLLKRVVNGVLKHVKKEGLEVAKHPVGLDEQVEDFENNMLQVEQQMEHVKVVGIVGMGGSGKTTLAKELYNRKRSNYGNRSCFLSDVRESAKKKGLEFLQGILLNELGFPSDNINSSSKGKELIRTRLRRASVLIVLDDIDHVDQFNDLMVRDELGPDSLVLVTSRSKNVLRQSGISMIYEKRMMNHKDAKELFCWHAFLQPHPMDGFGDLVEQFLSACGGLPLSLKVIGGQLYGNHRKSYWEGELEKNSMILLDDIKNRLEISYDALDPQEKEIFLDIACFFVGEQESKAIRILEGMGFERSVSHSLESLEDRCLIELADKNCLAMHDHLRDMGRDIAKKVRPPRLLSRSEQSQISGSKVSEFLKQSLKQGKLGMVGTRLFHHATIFYRRPIFATEVWQYELQQRQLPNDSKQSRRRKFKGYPFHARVSHLLVVDSDDQRVKGKFGKLLWLRWYKCPYKRIPSFFPMDNLRVLEVNNGMLETLWDDSSSQAPIQLLELNISFCVELHHIPKSIGSLMYLEKLLLVKTRLRTLPDEFCCLRSLKRLKLRSCTELKSLPDRFGDLTNLQHLDLSDCLQLQMLPHSFTQLTQLQYLCLRDCANLIIPLECFGKILTLKHVDFSGCTNLEVLPSQISGQRYLTTLRLDRTNLQDLPPSLGNLSCLKELRLRHCRNLRSLPETIGLLNCLEVLDIYCSEVENLPKGVAQLKNLEELCLDSIPIREVRLQKWSHNPHPFNNNRMFRLKRILLKSSVTTFISIAEDVCPNLDSLRIVSCPELIEIETLPTSLLSLEIRYCGVLKKVAGLSGLAKLRKLNIRHCAEIEELPSVAQLRSLEELKVEGCGKLENIQGVGHLSSLKVLNADGCWKLQSIGGLQKLERLDYIQISAEKWTDIRELQRLPSMSSTSIITLGATGEQTSGVKWILNCFNSPLSVCNLSSDRMELNLSEMEVDSCSALIMCFVYKTCRPTVMVSCISEKIECTPPSLIPPHSLIPKDCLQMWHFGLNLRNEEQINMCVETKDSPFLAMLKRGGYRRLRFGYSLSKLEMKAAWMWLARNGEEWKMLEVWNEVLTKMILPQRT